MSQNHQKRLNREYTGPSPHAVAIKARKSSRIPADQLILDVRDKDDQIKEQIRMTEQQQAIDLKLHWEVNTDKKIFSNQIKRRVDNKMRRRYISLEERRQMLRTLLAEEDKIYIEKAHSMKETIAQKQARMRLKSQQLKEKREAERLAIVNEKLDQQWQNQCEELRSVLSRRHQDQVCKERQYQLNLQAEIERERQAEEAMYAELWERDRLAKAAREENEAQAAMERTSNMLVTLQEQRKQNSIAKAADAEMIKLEAEQLTLDRLELSKQLQKRKDDELNSKSKYKQELQRHMESQKIAQKRDDQEELAMETKILQDLEAETKAEAIAEAKKKEQRKIEDAAYREYLKEQRLIDIQREKEIEKAIQQDVDAKEAQKREERRMKKQARDTYLQEVLTVRKQQVQEKVNEHDKEFLQIQKERDRVNKAVEQHMVHQQSNLEYEQNKQRQYARDLIAQQRYTDNLRRNKQILDNIEYEKGLQTEQAYESRLRGVLERADIQKCHPLRRNQLNRGLENGLIFKGYGNE